MTRARGIVAACGAAVCGVAGVAALKWYFVDVAIGQAGEPDRSMLFWGLPVVFIGAGAGVAAIVLGILAHKALTSVED